MLKFPLIFSILAKWDLLYYAFMLTYEICHYRLKLME